MDQAAIKQQIIQAIQASSQVSSDQGIDTFANNLSIIIVDAIKSATIILPAGSIQVAGSATSQNNPVPISVLNALS